MSDSNEPCGCDESKRLRLDLANTIVDRDRVVMTVTELQARLQEIIDAGNGDMTIVVQAMTGGVSGSGHATIESVFYGFDWDKGKVLIQPKETLLGAAYAEHRCKAARKAGRKQVSNVRRTRS